MKLSIRFYSDISKLNKQDKSPVKCRITFNKKRREFSTGLFINPKNWNSKQQQVTNEINRRATTLAAISHDIRTPINQTYMEVSIYVWFHFSHTAI